MTPFSVMTSIDSAFKKWKLLEDEIHQDYLGVVLFCFALLPPLPKCFRNIDVDVI